MVPARRTTSRLALALAAASLALPCAPRASVAAEAKDAKNAAETTAAPEPVLSRFEVREARVVDALRLLGEVTGMNVVPTTAAGEKRVTIYLRAVRPRDALETVCKVAGLWFREDQERGRPIRVMTTEEYQKDLVVFRDDRVKVYTLLYPNAVSIATEIGDLFPERVYLTLGTDEEDVFGGPAAQALSGLIGGLGGNGGTNGTNGATNGTGTSGVNRGGNVGRGAFGTGGGAFSRSVGGGVRTSFNNGGFGGTININNPRGNRDMLAGEALTTDQIEEIERRAAAAGEAAAQRATADAAQALSRREPPIYVTVNRKHNLLIVRTSDKAALAQIERLILDVDRPTPQVLLEMKVLELSLGDDFRSAFDIDFANLNAEAGPPGTQPRNPLSPTSLLGREHVLGGGNFPLEGGTFVYQFLSDRVRARVQLLETENRAQALATPLVLCANGRAARIFVGEERPLVRNVTALQNVTQGVVTQTIVPEVELRDIGNTLTIVPRINSDRTVSLTILHDNSTVQIGAATIPVPLSDGTVQEFPVDTVKTANIEGSVVAKDGLTLAIGGLIQQEVTHDEQKIPLLGDIPYLGFFFKRIVSGQAKREIVLLITPRVLMTPLEGQQVSRARLDALSLHPFVDKGDAAYDAFHKGDAPQAKDNEAGWIRRHLEPAPEPVK